MSKFYIQQGELQKSDALNIQGFEAFTNTLYVYEQVRLYNTVPLFLEEHMQRIITTLDICKIPIPQQFHKDTIQRYITRLLNVNKVYKGGVCTILITPSINKSNWECLLFIEPIEVLEFVFNSGGIRIGIFSDCIQSMPYVPSYCSFHSWHEFVARQISTMHELHAVTLCNNQSEIIGSSVGEFLCVFDNQVTVISNYVLPITRKILSIAGRLGFSISIQQSITVKQFLQSDEICIVHSITGMQWVSKCGDIAFGCLHTKKIWQHVVKDMLLWK
ncbi:MAG TPA: aminotransferase class IV [Bacteroidales bacterium]|jgi:hypothetical protein|nr:aminotransferase class IV [Bacteroidales bacterium]